jgi:hypothetical protein
MRRGVLRLIFRADLRAAELLNLELGQVYAFQHACLRSLDDAHGSEKRRGYVDAEGAVRGRAAPSRHDGGAAFGAELHMLRGRMECGERGTD